MAAKYGTPSFVEWLEVAISHWIYEVNKSKTDNTNKKSLKANA